MYFIIVYICTYKFFSLAQPFFDSEVTEELTEEDFREYRVNDFVYNMGNNTVMIKWKPLPFPSVIADMFMQPYTIDISLHSIDEQTEIPSLMQKIATNIPNTGSCEVTLPSIADPSKVVAVGIAVSETSVSELANDGNQDDYTIRDIFDQIKKVKKYIKNPLELVKDLVDIKGIVYGGAYRIACEAFSAVEPENIGDEINDRLPPCPPTSNRARRDRQFTRENPFLEYFTVGTIGQCYAQIVFDRYAKAV